VCGLLILERAKREETMLAGYEKSAFSSAAMDGKPAGYDVYSKGEGPVIVIIQELPGIGTETLRLADKLVNAGFRVVMPHLFGPLGRLSFAGNIARIFCMRREFALFAKNRSSPIVEWLKALCQHLRDKYEVSGVGVIGMCLSGNFAISLMADESVLASVASQPSLPLFAQSALHMSEQEIAHARSRLEEHGPMLAYRFEGDKLCTAAKFVALDEAFNDDLERIRLNTVPGDKHAMLTVHFIDEEGSPTDRALQEIIGYFGDKLGE
jgi:dienelactone hydrolase